MSNITAKELNLIVEEGQTYCKKWVNLPPSTLSTMSQDINPYDGRTQPEKYLLWEVGFWSELRRYYGWDDAAT